MHPTTQLLSDLVARPSVNPMGRDLPAEICLEHRVTDYLERFFRNLGVPFQRQTVAPGRDNILARCDISGSRRTLLFEAHQDTVPVDGMTIEPFTPHIENGRLYGRGSCDIKGGMAAMLGAFARLVCERPKGAASVIMACTVDEEHTFQGIQHLVRSGLRVDAAIVAEPTLLNIVHAHKGVVRWKATVHGRSCHSSRPKQGINAIYRMGRLLSVIERYTEQLRQSRTDPLLGPPTLSVGRIEGGISVNTVPDFCRIEIDRRVIPGEQPEQAPVEFARWIEEQGRLDFSVECGPLWLNCPPLAPDLSGALVEKLGLIIDQVRDRHQVLAVPYGTDASTLALAGIPAVVFGPGDIARAHTCDEWTLLEEVEMASEILYRLARAG